MKSVLKSALLVWTEVLHHYSEPPLMPFIKQPRKQRMTPGSLCRVQFDMLVPTTPTLCQTHRSLLKSQHLVQLHKHTWQIFPISGALYSAISHGHLSMQSNCLNVIAMAMTVIIANTSTAFKYYAVKCRVLINSFTFQNYCYLILWQCKSRQCPTDFSLNSTSKTRAQIYIQAIWLHQWLSIQE